MENHWENLPEELLQYQLTFLDVKSLLSVSLVSWAWHRRATSNSLWMRLAMRDWTSSKTGFSETLHPRRECQGKDWSWKKEYRYTAQTRNNWRNLRCHTTKLLPELGEDGSPRISNWCLVGSLVVTASQGPVVGVMDMRGELVRQLPISAEDIANVYKMETDGTTVLGLCTSRSGKAGAPVVLWDLESGTMLHSFRTTHERTQKAILRKPLMITSGTGVSMHVWDLQTCQQTRQLELQPPRWLDQIRLHATDMNLVIAGDGLTNKLAMWDLRSASNHPIGYVESADIITSWECYGDTIVMGHYAPCVWDLRASKLVHTAKRRHTNVIASLDFDSAFIVTGGEDGVIVYSMETCQLPRDPSSVHQVALGSEHILACGTVDGALYCAHLSAADDGPDNFKVLGRSVYPLTELAVDSGCIVARSMSGDFLLCDFEPTPLREEDGSHQASLPPADANT